MLGDGQHGIEQLDHRIMCNQALAVFGEDRGHPDAVVHRQAYEPAKQQVVLGLLHQQAFRAYAVENLQQHGSEQLLRRNAGPTALDIGGIHAREQRLNRLQSLIDHLANGPQGMVLWHEVVKATNAEQALGERIGSAHADVCGGWRDGFLINGSVRPQADFNARYFSSLLALMRTAQTTRSWGFTPWPEKRR